MEPKLAQDNFSSAQTRNDGSSKAPRLNWASLRIHHNLANAAALGLGFGIGKILSSKPTLASFYKDLTNVGRKKAKVDVF